MNGRQENENRIEKAIAAMLADAPMELQVWNNLMFASGLTSVTRRDRIQKVKAFLNGRTPAALTRNDVISYFMELRTKDLTDTYRTSIWYTLSSFCSYLYEEGITPSNYMEGIKRSKNHDPRKPITVTAKNMIDVKRSVSADVTRYGYAGGITLKNRDTLIVAILIETGLRETALTSIDINDINTDDNSLEVIEKGNVTRTIYLSDNTVTILNQWISDRAQLLDARQKDTGALFISRDGDRISHDVVRYVVKKYSGGKLNPHSMRAGYCSVLYDQTHDIEFVRRAVGHAYASTTQRYIRTDGKESKKGMEIINKSFN
jgi:integrase/recombinase XerC